MKTIFRTILILLGIICCLYCGAVIFIMGTGSWFNFAFGIIGVVLLLWGILFNAIRRTLKRIKFVKVILILIILACLVNFGWFEYNAISFSNSVPKQNASWMIILGAKVTNDHPSVEYEARLVKALEYIKDNPNTKIIVTGGQGADEIMTEAEAAFVWLTANGVSEDRIIQENKSTSTEENMKNAAQIIGNVSKGELNSNIVIVSSAFHLHRASKLATDAGLTNTTYSGSVGLKILLPQYYLREYAATVSTGITNHSKLGFAELF